MTTIVVRVCNQKGLHARAAAKFVRMADKFEAEISVKKLGAPAEGDDPSEYTSVCGTSILGLLLLAAECGSELEMTAQGAQAEEALAALEKLLAEKFGEEE